jgi:hypothetical protein
MSRSRRRSLRERKARRHGSLVRIPKTSGYFLIHENGNLEFGLPYYAFKDLSFLLRNEGLRQFVFPIIDRSLGIKPASGVPYAETLGDA